MTLRIITDKFASWKQSEGTPWLVAYIATLLIPWLLIFSRAGADAAGIVIGLLFLWHSHSRKNWQWLKDPFITVCLIAWAWMILVVTPFGVAKMASLGIAVPWIRFVLLFAALKNWVLLRRDALKFLAGWLTALMGFVVIDTLWQYVTGTSLTGHHRWDSGRLTGPMDGVKVGIYSAKLFLPTISLCLFFAFERGRAAVAAALGLFLAIVVTILLSGERTAFFSSAIAITAMVILVACAERKWRVACLSGFAFLLATAFVLLFTQDWLKERVSYLEDNIRNMDQTSYGQLFIAGIDLGKQHWQTGTGFKGFRELCLQLMTSEGISFCDLHPHNPYIEWFAEAGLGGLLLFIAMIGAWAFAALTSFLKNTGPERLLSVFALGTLIVNFFPLMATQSFFSNWPALLLWYSLSVAFAAMNLSKKA